MAHKCEPQPSDVVPTINTGKAVVNARLDTSGVMRLAHSVSTVSRPNGDALSQAPPLLSTFSTPTTFGRASDVTSLVPEGAFHFTVIHLTCLHHAETHMEEYMALKKAQSHSSTSPSIMPPSRLSSSTRSLLSLHFIFLPKTCRIDCFIIDKQLSSRLVH